MNLILTSLIVLASTFSFGQSQELKIKVELTTEINEDEVPPFCGIMAFFSVFEFNVTKIIKGDYNKDNIFICIPCARDLYLAGKLKYGKTYAYTLVKPENEESSCDKGAPSGYIIYNLVE